MVQQLHIHLLASGMETGTTLYRVLQTRDEFVPSASSRHSSDAGRGEGWSVLGSPHTGHILASMLPVFPMVPEFAGWIMEGLRSLIYVSI